MRVEQSLLAESWNPPYAGLGFNPDDDNPPFLQPAMSELIIIRPMRPEVLHSTCEHISLKGQDVEYHLVRSKTATKLRIKVSLAGIKIVLPAARDLEEARSFLAENGAWVLDQVARAQRLSTVRRPDKTPFGSILPHGEITPIRVVRTHQWRAPNRVLHDDEGIVITCGSKSLTPPATSLENWLRKNARQRIDEHLVDAIKRVKRSPNRVYIMAQRTKWGNCSALGNLSFNWRLIMAPDVVLRYIVMREVLHLATIILNAFG